ncbi:Twin-arginine translocation pathway signal sequence domain-containing protein [Burkholderia sp. WAC0059]|uniref:DUF1501 domain-containing protein n=1 Tax=Burkholderia sp. WAC0059 TaxID=2066022 RepID=UPI000C7EA3A2|nr:DUF1501 domain-containing protein [Burkholderia sp. WAC0059]PLZ03778.1 Twin-arginine translocation pathway signal sequence domain-containing protein [Burkholderia sp. WAC0059]
MKRRDFLAAMLAAGVSPWLPGSATAQTVAGGRPAQSSIRDDNLLILVELNGGNDGLNTVVPFADPLYRIFRPNIGLPREQLLPIDARTALHSALAPMLPLWQAGQLAIVQGVGYAQPNLSHYRSREIWETASPADTYLREGWLARAFAVEPSLRGFVAGSAEMGPFDGSGNRVTASASTAPGANVTSPVPLEMPVPDGPFGASVEAAMRLLAANGPAPGVSAIRLTLDGFDTHENQPERHAALLAQLAQGFSAMRDALVGMGRWARTVVMTYAEFGRSVRENTGNGTDHGTVAPCFVAGGRVLGGLYGTAPQLAQLDSGGQLPVGVDFRRLYATVLGPWWGLDAQTVLHQHFEPLPLLRT